MTAKKPPIPPEPNAFREIREAHQGQFDRSMYFDRDGVPITFWEWSVLAQDFSYKVVRKTRLSDIEISTVWLGANHRFIGEGPPLIFETMIFETEPTEKDILGRKRMVHEEVLDLQERYATEEAALERHAEIVEFLTLRKLD